MYRPLIIYHDDCIDGLASASIVYSIYPYAYLQPLNYEDVLDYDFSNYIKGNHTHIDSLLERPTIYVIDFSFPISVINNIKEAGADVIIIDHHATSYKSLQPYLSSNPNWLITNGGDKSGALLTWDYFYKDKQSPLLYNLISDRDTWQFSYLLTNKTNAALVYKFFSDAFNNTCLYTKCIELFNLSTLPEEKLTEFIIEYSAKADNHRQDILDNCLDRVSHVLLEDHIVPLIEIKQSELLMNSDIIQVLKDVYKPLFAVSILKKGERYKYSLRSDKDKGDFDVTTICEKYGGGGHKNAAGFVVPYPIHINIKTQ